METIVRTICQAEGIDARRVSAVSGGQVNRVFLVDSRYVVRIGGREDAFARLSAESELLRRLENTLPVPRVLACGQRDGLAYQIQAAAAGEKLSRAWQHLSPRAQEKIVAELAGYLAILHGQGGVSSFGAAGAGGAAFAAWEDYLDDQFTRTLGEIAALRLRIAPGFLDLARETYQENRPALAGMAPTLVHGDLTPANILVHHGRITALLDFEFALHAARDYELWVLEAFCLYPNDWTEEDGQSTCSADFAAFARLLRRHYPTPFETPDWRRRLNLYQVVAALGSYLEWRKDNLAELPPDRMAAKGFYMARIANFSARNGARMFA